MSAHTRRRTATVGSVAVLATVALLAPIGAAQARPSAGGHPAGVIDKFTLKTGVVGEYYDVATRSDGRAFIGWVSSTAGDSTRLVHLCTLPVGATSCLGGVQTVTPVNTDPVDLHVVVTSDNVAHLVWFEDTPNSVNGPHGAIIYEAQALDGQNLTGPMVLSDAPSFGELLAVEVAPDNTIWTVTNKDVATKKVELRAGGAPFESVDTPYGTGLGLTQFAFAGGKQVLTVEKYGTLSTAAHYTSRQTGGTFGAYKTLSNTWASGQGAAMETTRHGLRIVTGVDNSSYRPVISKWTGSAFTKRQLTADKNNCSPYTHDGAADPSGRLLDASWECDTVTVTNYADAFHAAITRFKAPSTPTDAPQAASGTRGIATVVYSYERQPGQTGDILAVAHVRLPDSTYTVGNSNSGGRVTVTGPRSCLPPVNVPIGWSHKPANGWSFKSGKLELNGKSAGGSPLDGATLTAGKSYTLTGTATFARNGNTKTVKASLTFKSCASS